MNRQLEPAMLKWLDKKLASNGLARDAIATKKPRLLFRLAMEACVGIREATGRNDGPMVELIQSTIGNAANESWCMSFVQTALAYAEKRTGQSSPIAAGEHCLTVWAETPKAQRVKDIPAIGAIIIWRHGLTSNGHTGITIGEVEGTSFDTVEGNTAAGIDNGGEIVRDGQGVYANRRSIKGTGNMRVVGFLRPF